MEYKSIFYKLKWTTSEGIEPPLHKEIDFSP